MIDTKSSISSLTHEDEIERQYDDLIKEFDSFQEKVQTQARTLRENKLVTIQKLSVERSSLLEERRRLEEEKESWRKEKERIN